MKNKKVIIIVLVIAIILLSTFIYVETGKRTLYSETLYYLTDVKDYKKSEFKIENSRHSFINRILSYPEWRIDVIFNDEPDKSYTYTYDPDDNTIMQYGGVGGKHFEED